VAHPISVKGRFQLIAMPGSLVSTVTPEMSSRHVTATSNNGLTAVHSRQLADPPFTLKEVLMASSPVFI
jgi:hypothetical protein